MIEAIKEKDLTEWAHMCVAVYGEDATVEEMLREYHNGQLPYEYGYYADGKLVGFISLSLRHDYVEGTASSPVGYIEGIYVDDHYRHEGIARQLVGFAKEWAANQGCRQLASDCLLDNTASLAFHLAVGFAEANRNIHFTMNV